MTTSAQQPSLSTPIRLQQQKLSSILPTFLTATDASLLNSMQYSVAGGKHLRPLLAWASARTISSQDHPEFFKMVCAIECIHAYSLVHDDLPAMDNDAIRHGKPSCHKQFGEAMAILAGDALQSQAFQLLAELQSPCAIQLLQELAGAAGSRGMVAGQVLDIRAETQAVDLDGLNQIHRLKTGALIRASVRMGAILQQANAQQLHALTIFAEEIGLAFQIQDDILDRIGDPNQLGKTQGKDLQQGKSTFVTLLGLTEAKRQATATLQSALDQLEIFGTTAQELRELAHYIVQRGH